MTILTQRRMRRINRIFVHCTASSQRTTTEATLRAEFKKKGWHAQYDRECGYYAVFQGTRALGEHQALYTRNLF